MEGKMLMKVAIVAAVTAVLWTTGMCDPGTALQAGCAAAAMLGDSGEEDR